MKRIFNTTLMACLFAACVWTAGLSQVNWTAQYMGRAEYRHGFQALAAPNQDPAFFLSQRARLGFRYTAERFKIGVSVQDIRTWGSSAHGAIDVGGLLSLHEGWAEVMLNNKLSLKAGRQEIDYDDARIFGNLDWAMQARRHDAALVKWEDSTMKVHVGAAYNQDREQSVGTIYNVAGNYKTFQYVYFSKQWNALNFSVLALNNGMQWVTRDSLGAVTGSGVRFSQTAGLRANYKKEKFGVLGWLYYQFGKDAADRSISAFDVAAEAWFQPMEKLKLTAGAEVLSGTTQIGADPTKTNSFSPFYGTNHRFNGYMDYFYVGNHANSVGLIDPFLKVLFSLKKTYVGLDAHFFMAAADVRDPLNPTQALSSYLGTEVDLSVGYSIVDFVSIQAGYSHMLGTDALQALRGGDTGEISNWAYVMLLVRPGMAKFPRSGLKI